MISATRVLAFLQDLQHLRVERNEVLQPAFNELRSSVRELVETLLVDTDLDAHEAARALRAILAELLTTPAAFGDSISRSLQSALGEVSTVRRRWGVDLARAYECAIQASGAMAEEGSDLRALVGKALAEMVGAGEDFRIYCHKASMQYFESLFPDSIPESRRSKLFIHSGAEYRETNPFGTLVKVGPLRAFGWGSIPDGVLTAPRFGRLLQFVWAGCADEDGFGYDPLAHWNGEGASDDGIQRPSCAGVPRIVSIARHGASSVGHGSTIESFDELKALADADRPSGRHPAVLVQIDSEHGILFPAQAKVLSLDPHARANDAIARRLVGSLECGRMLLIRPAVHHELGGELQAEHAPLSKIWKARLTELWKRDQSALTEQLFDAGVHLLNLDSGLKHWMKAPTTVVHAPQKRAHFRVLMRILGLHDNAPGVSLPGRRIFWEVAWEEVGRSRGEAIQAGVFEHGAAEEQLTEHLQDQLDELRELAQFQEDFSVHLHGAGGLNGHALFFPIVALEEGFLAPEQALRTVCELAALNQWRA